MEQLGLQVHPFGRTGFEGGTPSPVSRSTLYCDRFIRRVTLNLLQEHETAAKPDALCFVLHLLNGAREREAVRGTLELAVERQVKVAMTARSAGQSATNWTFQGSATRGRS